MIHDNANLIVEVVLGEEPTQAIGEEWIAAAQAQDDHRFGGLRIGNKLRGGPPQCADETQYENDLHEGMDKQHDEEREGHDIGGIIDE